jgi:hypothetical protein
MGFTVNNTLLAPITSAGAAVAEAPSADATLNGRGVYTLTAATTYYFVLPVGGSAMYDVHLQHDAAIAITSATIQTCSMPKRDVSDISSVAGAWIDQDPETAFVGTDGATTTASDGVVAVVAGNVGGANWQISDAPAARSRLEVIVGATGGEVRLGFCGKE